MHEVAAIIGEKNTDLYLVPVFEQFMKDVEEVKLGILRHLSEFFRVSDSVLSTAHIYFSYPLSKVANFDFILTIFQSVSKEMRGKLLSVLATLLHSDSENEKNWRFRYEYTWYGLYS